MASELKNALDQLKTEVAALTGVTRAQLGPYLDNIKDATDAAACASITLNTGQAANDTYTATVENHLVHMRFYWLLKPTSAEVVEQNMATFWDVLMTDFYTEGTRNLSNKVTIALANGEGGRAPYTAVYEQFPSGAWYRVLVCPVELILNTHQM